MRPGLMAIAALAIGVVLQPLPALGQAAPPPPLVAAARGQPLSAEQLDQLLAPVALYPDALLGQILTAATYPLEIVEAARWLQDPEHAVLTGDELAAALASLPWDLSVKSLVPFPRILQLMDSRLDWMEAVGDAFLAQQPAVMDALQRLRERAQAAGTLQSTPNESVQVAGGDITIAPAEPGVVYVPVYDPVFVYGTWPYPDYPPFWFPPPPGFHYDGTGFLWWDVPIVGPFWGWWHWHWHQRQLWIGPHGVGGNGGGRQWQHDPVHRRGVPYPDAATAGRFAPGAIAHPALPRVYRGFDSGPTASPPHAFAPEASPRPAAPLFDSFPRGGEARGDAARGRASQMTIAPRPAMPGGRR